MNNIETMKLAQDLRALADRFSEGWHDGIKIDASDIVLLATVASAIEQAHQAEPVYITPPQGIYYTPPPRQPLTDEEIKQIWLNGKDHGDDWLDVQAIARAIEAALLEKQK